MTHQSPTPWDKELLFSITPHPPPNSQRLPVRQSSPVDTPSPSELPRCPWKSSPSSSPHLGGIRPPQSLPSKTVPKRLPMALYTPQSPPTPAASLAPHPSPARHPLALPSSKASSQKTATHPARASCPGAHSSSHLSRASSSAPPRPSRGLFSKLPPPHRPRTPPKPAPSPYPGLPPSLTARPCPPPGASDSPQKLPRETALPPGPQTAFPTAPASPSGASPEAFLPSDLPPLEDPPNTSHRPNPRALPAPALPHEPPGAPPCRGAPYPPGPGHSQEEAHGDPGPAQAEAAAAARARPRLPAGSARPAAPPALARARRGAELLGEGGA